MPYICYNCNQLSDESDLDYVSNRYGEFYKRERVCPFCHSNEIEPYENEEDF